MNCLALPILAVAVLGADLKLPPPIRLESGGEIAFGNLLPGVTGITLSPDGKSLFAVVKDGERYDLVAWDIPRKSKTVLTTAAPFAYLSPSPDGKSVLSCIALKGGEDRLDSDEDVFIWDTATKARNALPRFKCGLLAGTREFSRDGTILVISDGYTNKVHLWKRDAVGKWGVFKVLDVAQRKDAAKQHRLTTVLTPDAKHVFVLFVTTREEYGFGIEKWDTFGGRRLDFTTEPIYPLHDIIAQVFFLAGEKTFCIAIAGTAARGEEEAGALGIDVASGKRRYIVPVLLTGASLSPDGRTGASVAVEWARDTVNEPSSALVSLWNFDDGTRLRQVTVPAGKVLGGEAVGGDERPFGIFSADSRFFVLAAGDASNHIHVIDVKKAGARSSLKIPWLDGERVIEIEKPEIAASFTADAPIKGLFLLNSGEIAAVGVEPKAVLIWKIKTP